MINRLLVTTLVLTILGCQVADATEADDTTITITARTEGPSPFIYFLTLTASDTTVIRSIQFSVAPKPDSVTRPLSGTYTLEYLAGRGDVAPATGTIRLPVYGLYDGYANSVMLTFNFLDGSSSQQSTAVTTATFSDPCGYNSPTVLQQRTTDRDLSYDYILIKGKCAGYSPPIIDSDGALRWIVPTGTDLESFTAAFFNNSIFFGAGTMLYRVDLDGTLTPLVDYASRGVVGFHHNIDPGKTGLLLSVDTTTYVESVVLEVDGTGRVLKTWNMADIISEAMLLGGDNPDQFVYSTPTDWFHNNGVTYNRADDSLLVSSRENFVICIDYSTGAIKWIFGDTTKHWYEFPSLRQYALTSAPDTLAPIGEHGISIAFDQDLLLFDNGTNSFFQMPPGINRPYASPRKYRLDLEAKTATEVWHHERNQSVLDRICSSVYEDAPYNYLVDYANIQDAGGDVYAELLGLDRDEDKIFHFRYPFGCSGAFNAFPLHLENTSFPAVQRRALNLSARGVFGSDQDSLIGGFIVTGINQEKVVFRALGPSLAGAGIPNVVADPAITVYDSQGTAIATNDDWQNDPAASQIAAAGLAPTDPKEAATLQMLDAGAYTFVVDGKDSVNGIGLVEAYDLSPLSNAALANVSARGSIGTDDDVLITGFIVGDVGSATVIIRALGPSLASSGITDPLADPKLVVYDRNGAAIASNDNWQDDVTATDVQKNGLAPANAAEAATILHLAAGTYTTIVSGADGGTGVGLVEVFNLE
jgi:arylsulfate sulfotransferase